MALFEVRAEPMPDWMELALREELDKLSPGGWTLFAEFGAPATALFDTAIRCDWLPDEPTKRAAIDARLNGRVAEGNSIAPPAEVLAGHDADPSNGGPPHPATMTLSAAWLCELLDNYVMLDSLRSATGEIAAMEFELAGATSIARPWRSSEPQWHRCETGIGRVSTGSPRRLGVFAS